MKSKTTSERTTISTGAIKIYRSCCQKDKPPLKIRTNT